MVWGSLINSLNMQVHDIFKCWKRDKREARERKREKRDALLKIGFNLIWVIGFFNQIWVGLISGLGGFILFLNGYAMSIIIVNEKNII